MAVWYLHRMEDDFIYNRLAVTVTGENLLNCGRHPKEEKIFGCLLFCRFLEQDCRI